MKKRIISAAIVIAVLIPIFILGGWVFAVAVGAIGLLAYKEVIDLKEKEKKLPGLVKAVGALCLLLLTYMSFDGYSFAFGLSYKSVGLVILLLLLPTLVFHKKDKYNTKDAFYLIGFILLLGVFFNALIVIENYNVLYLLFLIFITVVTDSFAFFIGKLIGKHPITEISPKKTWEGSIGGSIAGTIISTIFFVKLVNTDVNLIKIIIIIFGLSIIGQLGDLLFSKIKRENNIKDFSNIMPGHGGVLDRLDSLIFVVLTYLVLFTLI